MANLGGFNAAEVSPQTEFAPLPAGKYLAVITESESKATQKGGELLALTFEVTEGEYKGRKLWARLNLVNASDEAVKIARSELSAICHAVGVMKPNDSCELHNIPLVLKVIVEKRKDTGDMTNRIKSYESRSAASAATPRPASAGGPAPWARS